MDGVAEGSGRLRRAWPWFVVAVAFALVPLTVWGLWVTGGVGALVVGAGLAVGAVAFALRPPRVVRRRRAARHKVPPTGRARQRSVLGAIAKGLVAAFVVWNLLSMVMYVTRHNTADPLQQRVATWGRDHGYGPIIDYLEASTYDKPPTVAPADDLTLNEGITLPPTTPPPTGPATTPESTAPPTTAVPVPQPPAPLATFFSPALAGEGQWTLIASAGGHPALWATSIRPFPAAGGVVASMAVIDQTYLRAGLFNGDEEPGGDWVRDDRVPPELYASLVAAMNSGFRFEHISGGYVTEGRTLKALRDGDATIAIGRDGKMVIGALGRDLFDDGTWVSLRQNLMLMVDGGVSTVNTPATQGVWWGADYGREVYVNRSAVCELADGRLAYLMVGKVDAAQMAQSLINVGCLKAVQLDINGTWPNFFTFGHNADGSVQPVFLDRRMGSNTYRYIRGSAKEFFAFFDVTLVPEQSVLDA